MRKKANFCGDENLQVYTGYCSDLKADRGCFMHVKMSSIPPIIAMIFVLVRHAFFGGVAQHWDFFIILSICACRHASHH